MADLIQVLETELGLIKTGFGCRGSDACQIVLYAQSESKPRCVSTLGLSKLSEFREQGSNRFEFFLQFANDLDVDRAGTILDNIVSWIILGEMPAPLRGSYLEWPQGILEDDNTKGVYFTHFHGSTHPFQSEMSELAIIPVSVVPIVQHELDILNDQGWPDLEDYWERNPLIDLANLNR